MNNIHIIHGIQYLQNIKYKLYVTLNSSFALEWYKFPLSYQFSFKESRDLGKTMFYIHTKI